MIKVTTTFDPTSNLTAMTNFFSTASDATGAAYKMSAAGVLPYLLTNDAKRVPFRQEYVPFLDFSPCNVIQSAGTVRWGQTLSIEPTKVGDVLYDITLLIGIYGISACASGTGSCGASQGFVYAASPSNPCAETDTAYFDTVTGGSAAWQKENYGACGSVVDTTCAVLAAPGEGDDPWCYYANEIGHVIPQHIALKSASMNLAVLDSMTLHYLSETQVCAGHRDAVDEMIGRRTCVQDLIADSGRNRTLRVSLPFPFQHAPGNVLYLCHVISQKLILEVRLCDLKSAVVVSGADVTVIRCDTGASLTDADIEIGLDMQQPILTGAERNLYSNNNFDQLVTLTEIYTDKVTSTTLDYKIPTNSLVSEVFWSFRRPCATAVNDWFNFTGINGLSPMVSAQFLIDSHVFQPSQSAVYYNSAQAVDHHTSAPRTQFFMLAIADKPEEHLKPSGFLNCVRVNNFVLRGVMQPGLGSVDLHVAVRTINFFKYQDNTVSRMFA